MVRWSRGRAGGRDRDGCGVRDSAATLELLAKYGIDYAQAISSASRPRRPKQSNVTL